MSSKFSREEPDLVQEKINTFADGLQNFGVDSVVVLVVAGTPKGYSLSWAQRGNHYSCIGSAQRWLDDELTTRPDKENEE